MEETTGDLARSVGEVCIAASALEWTLAFLASVLRQWSDAQFVDVVSRPGQPLREFRKLANDATALGTLDLQAEAVSILADAERLLEQRHRVVHSVMIEELEPGSRFYDAWHAKTDAVWSVDPAGLRDLAHNLERCAIAADALGTEWEERTEPGARPEPGLADDSRAG